MTLLTSNSPRAFGAYASAWAARLSANAPYALADPSGFGDAFVDIVETRRLGRQRGVFVLFEHPRRVLMRTVAQQLTENTSYDVFLNRMAALAAGAVSVNNQQQAVAEGALYGPAIAHVWTDLSVTADRLMFRSRYEFEAATAYFGHRARRVAFAAPDDPRVPPPAQSVERAPTIAIWAAAIDDALVRAFVRMTSDIKLEPIVIRNEPLNGHRCVPVAESAELLAASSVIVSISDDPGTARSLARFRRPLCAATHGAAEYIEGVQTFDIWNAAEAIDAMLRALGNIIPHVTQEAQPMPTLEPPPVFDAQTAPLVSIVMAVYNRLDHLKANLESLQHQTYPNIEVIVVSNDGPRADDICAAFPNVRYIHRDSNTGEAGQPRNDGIAAARGEFIATLDDDDIFFNDHIAQMVAACSDGLDVVYSNFLIQIVAPQADGTETLLGYDIEKGVAITPIELMIMNRIGYMTVFARKTLYDRLGAYDLSFTGGSEVELWLRMSSNAAMAHVERPTTMYTIRKNWEGSLTGPNHQLFIDGYEQLYRLHPANGQPLIEAGRVRHLASLRASGAASRQPRYLVAQRSAN